MNKAKISVQKGEHSKPFSDIFSVKPVIEAIHANINIMLYSDTTSLFKSKSNIIGFQGPCLHLWASFLS